MAAIIVLIGIAIYSAKRQRLVSFGILWFLGNLIIESSVIGLEIIFDHRTYLPSMFVVLIAVLLIQRYARPKIVGFIFLGAVAIMFSIWTYERNGTWSDEVTLWQDCVKKSPNKARPHNNLGLYLSERSRSEDAMRHYSEALRIKPDYAEAHNNMCAVLYNQGRIQEAFTHCTAALRMKPGYADAQNNLGIVLATQGKLQEGILHFSEAVRLKPHDADYHFNLANALAGRGKHKEAVNHYSKASGLNPFDAELQEALKRAESLAAKSDMN